MYQAGMKATKFFKFLTTTQTHRYFDVCLMHRPLKIGI